MCPHLIRDDEQSTEPSERSDGELSSETDDDEGEECIATIGQQIEYNRKGRVLCIESGFSG